MAEPPADRHFARVFCVKCAADVTALPLAARFCSRCGSPLPEHFYRDHSPHAAAPETPPGAPSVTFPPREILLAYAKALLNLAWRYESALGSRRNLEEAARCYWKTGRLHDAAGEASARCVAGTPPPFAAVYTPPISGPHF